MARIAFAWELGGEYGHAMGCAALAGALEARGHRIAFVARELKPLGRIREALGYDLFQAPLDPDEGRAAEMPASYAEILLGSGYRDAAALTPLVGAWREVLARWRADLLLADFAPTALLAAQSLGLRRATFGTGFFTPPRTTPLPSFRFDEPVAPERLAAADAQALASVNGALKAFGAPALGRLADLFAADEDFLCTFPELDHYGGREASGYWGPRARLDHGIDMAWPRGTGRRIFVYAKRTAPAFDALVEALATCGERVIAFVPELDAAHANRLASAGVALAARPARLDRLLRECDLAIGHGGELAAAVLTLGVPQLLLPMQYEQYITARRIEQLGAGAWIGGAADAPTLAATIARLLAASEWRDAADRFARRHGAYSPAEQRRRLVQRVEALAHGGLPRGDAAPILAPKPPPGRRA